MEILRINIKTGEGFCRIEELWEFEGIISEIPPPEEETGEKEGS